MPFLWLCMCVSHALCVSISMHKCVFNITASGHVSLQPTSSDTHRQEVGMDVRWTDHSPYIRERERERDTGRQRKLSLPWHLSAFSPASTHPVSSRLFSSFTQERNTLQESMRSWERAVSHYKNIAFHTSACMQWNFSRFNSVILLHRSFIHQTNYCFKF